MIEWTRNESEVATTNDNNTVVGVQILNELIQWLGFKDCSFHRLLEENTQGISRDDQTVTDLGRNCRYPY